MKRTLVVVGASLAGLSTARAARAQGFDGRVIVIGDEEHRPYDRPPLSKQFLDGSMSEADLALEAPDEDLDVEWVLGQRALQLDPSTRSVLIAGGRQIVADDVVVATGARARWLNLSGSQLPGVHILRTLEDAQGLRADLLPGKRLVVVGAGFIGAEIASTAKKLGLDVTVLEVAPTPLAGPLGVTMGEVIGRLHEAHGVDLRTGVTIDHVEGVDRVTGVELADSTVLEADVVVAGVGATPNVEWLRDTDLDLANGVVCDAVGGTGIPHVAAVGDCAAWLDPAYGQPRRIEHWTGALDRPAVAVANLLGTGATVKPVAPPYFWSDQYDSRLQFTGASSNADRISYEVGSPDDDSYLAVYWEGDVAIGALGVNCVRPFTKFRRELATRVAQQV